MYPLRPPLIWLFAALYLSLFPSLGSSFKSSVMRHGLRDFFASANHPDENLPGLSALLKCCEWRHHRQKSFRLHAGNRDQVYFDIEVKGTALGRLTFDIADESLLPQHIDNLKKLCTGERRSIDPLARYDGCEFEFSPAYIEDGSARYRWSHILRGRGRNAVGDPTKAISDPESVRACAHNCFGGSYYGEKYQEAEGDPGVLLTLSVTGPGCGTSRFTIVRVGESPKEWGERLLSNSAVVGRLESGLDVLHAMARQRIGPPKVVGSGVVQAGSRIGSDRKPGLHV